MRPNGAHNICDPDCRESADLRGSKPRAGACCDFTFPYVSAARPDVLTGDRLLYDLDAIAMIDHSFHGDDGVSTVGHRSASGNAGRGSQGKSL